MKNKIIWLVILIVIATAALLALVLVKRQTKTAGPPSSNQTNSVANQSSPWPARVNEGGGLTIEAQPLKLAVGQPTEFMLYFNTHQGNLELDLTRQAALIDDLGNQYQPVSWTGGSGGHHLSGKLIFPPLQGSPRQLKLTLSNVYEVLSREFVWDLP